MPNEEARQAKALEGIERYVKELVPIFKTINQNLVDFAKIAQNSETNALEELNKHLAPEGYEFVKEEPQPCPGCGLMFCEIEGCGSKKEVDEKLPCGCTVRDHQFGEHLDGE